METTEKQIRYYQKWGKSRAFKIKFILTHGILNFALPFSVFMIFFDLMDKGFILNLDFLYSFLILLSISSVIGALSALYTYKKMDKIYIKLKEESVLL